MSKELAMVVEHVTKKFRTKSKTVTAVSDVSFSIGCGEIVALLGENGAGKTTLVDILLGISKPDDGGVQLFGTTSRSAIEQGKVGAILQTGGLLKELTVKDQINMVAATYAHPIDVQTVMDQAGVTDFQDRKIEKCSGGQQQKVKFALALLASPALLILDEPTTGVDVNAREEFWASMKTLTDAGTTILFATHYLEEAEHFAERIIVMGKGEVLADQTVRELRNQSGRSRFSFNLPAEEADAFDHWVAQQQNISLVDLHETAVTFTSETPEVHALELLQHFALTNLEIQKPSLDDIFKDLTRSNLR